jgi:hypothetical protein
MVGHILDDKLEKTSGNLESTRSINDVGVKQNTGTQKVITNALRHMGEPKKEGEVATSRFVEVSSMDIATSVLRHLQFAGMDDRHEEVEENYTETFKWAYTGLKSYRPWSSLSSWLRGDDRLYWVCGKAGSGKSTLMRYLFDNPRTRDDLRFWSGDMQLEVVAYFFWNGGTREQRSCTGLRSLLFRILRHRIHLIPHVLPELWEVEMWRILRPSPGPAKLPTWTLIKLEQAFKRLATQGLMPVKICLFIDGLNEYDGKFSDIIDFCQFLAALPNFKLCMSSRPLVIFEHAFRTQPRLRLQDLTVGDIEIYARGMLLSHEGLLRLAQRKPDGAPRLITEL